MINKSKKVLLLLLLTTSLAANGASVYLSDLNVNPVSPLTSDFIVAGIEGSYATPGYFLVDAPMLSISGNDIAIDFMVNSPSGIVPDVLDPFSYMVDVGNLNVGFYNIRASFYVDAVFDDAIDDSFIVSAVPIPPAVFLFLSGVISFYAFAKKKRPDNGDVGAVERAV